MTFQDRYTLHVGGERVQLAWHGSNHTPDNIYIHFPDHDTLMLVDIVNSGWVPIYNLNLSEDVPGYIAAPTTALSYPWKHYIGGHVGRLGTRDDVVLHQQYVADIARQLPGQRSATVDPTPYFVKYGANAWAAVKAYLDAVTDYAAAPVIAKYTGVLAAADVVHHQHHVHRPGVDPPRPRRRLAGPPVTRIGVILGSTRPGAAGEQVARWVIDRPVGRSDADSSSSTCRLPAAAPGRAAAAEHGPVPEHAHQGSGPRRSPGSTGSSSSPPSTTTPPPAC